MNDINVNEVSLAGVPRYEERALSPRRLFCVSLLDTTLRVSLSPIEGQTCEATSEISDQVLYEMVVLSEALLSVLGEHEDDVVTVQPHSLAFGPNLKLNRAYCCYISDIGLAVAVRARTVLKKSEIYVDIGLPQGGVCIAVDLGEAILFSLGLQQLVRAIDDRIGFSSRLDQWDASQRHA